MASSYILTKIEKAAPQMKNPAPAAIKEAAAPVGPKLPYKGLAPLGFRVSSEFQRAFKTYAAEHDLKLNALLSRAFETLRAQQGD
jgi:hypothetical protein